MVETNTNVQEIQKEDLNLAFLSRKKIGSYKKIPIESIHVLKNVFFKNPFPSKSLIKELSQTVNESECKIRDWFKSQRKRDFCTTQKIIKTYKKNRTFGPAQKAILEAAFKENNQLSNEKLSDLESLLNCPSMVIKQWFYYRNRKLVKELGQKRDSKKSQLLMLRKQKTISKAQNYKKKIPENVSQQKENLYDSCDTMEEETMQTSQTFLTKNNENDSVHNNAIPAKPNEFSNVFHNIPTQNANFQYPQLINASFINKNANFPLNSNGFLLQNNFNVFVPANLFIIDPQQQQNLMSSVLLNNLLRNKIIEYNLNLAKMKLLIQSTK